MTGRKRSAPDDDDVEGGRAATSAAGVPSPSNAPRPDEEAGTKASGTASKTNELVGPLLIGEASDLTPEAFEQFCNLSGFISAGFWRKDLPGFLKRLKRDLEAYPILARLYSDDNQSLLDILFQSASKSPDNIAVERRLRTDKDFQAAMKCLIEANPSVLLWKERRHLNQISKACPDFLLWLAGKFPWILDLSIEPFRGQTGQGRPLHFAMFIPNIMSERSSRPEFAEERRQRYDRIMQFYLSYPQGLAQKDSDGELPLHMAIRILSGFEIIKWVAEQYPGGLSSQNIYGDTPLHLAVRASRDLDIVQWLASQYPDAISVVSRYDRSPLDLSLEYVAADCQLYNDMNPSSFFEPSLQVSEFLLKMDPSKLRISISNLDRVWGFCHKQPVQEYALKLLRVLIGKRGGTVEETLAQYPFPKAIVPLIVQEFQIISERDRIRKAHILLAKYAEQDNTPQKSDPPKEEGQSLISPRQQLFVAYRDWMNNRLAQKVSETPRVVNIRKSMKAIQEEFISKGIRIHSVYGDIADNNFLVDDDDDDDSHWNSEDEE